ncbi:hypothetical protein G15_0684 [Enterococcus avium]|uniref:LPXTG cell wall anchor domain-containing protein n=1 Tax=Enterococcus malodoratus TaxID=71451 RepID=UPI0008C643F8|nr:LPXTG cell wall anchor domain-containing protein [Enterococcus malodoratus]BBM17043.1 hypothetical protein G15_0684 [Enterococcus avium]SES94825.1 LPXTG-motif cell wall anchor domain-containing protein [Enterococcus malodoratus]
MESGIQLTGILGSSEEQLIPSSEKRSEMPNNQITNVQITVSYPKTGEYQHPYLVVSGVCLLLIMVVLRIKKRLQ